MGSCTSTGGPSTEVVADTIFQKRCTVTVGKSFVSGLGLIEKSSAPQIVKE
jgi:hypothetical protein